MANSDLILLLNIGEERTAILNKEVENAVLIRKFKGRAEYGRKWRRIYWGEVEQLEWRKHAESELNVISGWRRVRNITIP